MSAKRRVRETFHAIGLGAVLSATALGAAAAPGDAASTTARDAAMRELKSPEGTGGCILLSIPRDVRREALISALARQTTPIAFKTAVSIATPKCTARTYSSADLPLVGSVVAALRKSAAALELAQQFGVGQRRLDEAWAAATSDEKAAYYDAAEEYLRPGDTMTPRVLDVAPLARKSGLATGAYEAAEASLRSYFLYTALSERSEAALDAAR